jgi:hypothetical protein
MPCFLLATELNENCSSIRLDSSLGPLRNTPIYNQGDEEDGGLGICYAISAAILLDYERLGSMDIVDQQLTSPLSLAAAWKSRASRIRTERPFPNSDILDSGFVFDALESAHGIQICDQRFLG